MKEMARKQETPRVEWQVKIQRQSNEGVDGIQEVLHNLISLLQTKRFAAKRKKRSGSSMLIDSFESNTEYRSLTINSQ